MYEVGVKEWCELFSHPHEPDDSYMVEWENLITCVAEHKTPLITGEDGLKVLQIIEAARISAASDGQVPLAIMSQTRKASL